MVYQVLDSGVVRDATAEEAASTEARSAESFAADKDAAIARTYIDVDQVTFEARGNRIEEYKDAEAAARAYVDAGYAGVVDSDVSSWAQHNPTGQVQTNAWAADQIIARADALRAAKKEMRSKRFEHQSAMRAAATADELAAAVADWQAFIAGVRMQLRPLLPNP